ncbi:hypothetical protein [Nocardia thailandica]
MATGVGLRVADDESIAAVVTEDGTTHYIVRESVLHLAAGADDGDTALGGEPPADAHSIREFVRAIGDPAGVDVDGGEAYRAEDLFATAMFCLINLASEHLSGPAEFYATHPPQWSEATVRAVREALDYLGLKSVALLGEDEMPVDADAPGAGKAYASAAANAALVAVLATPAGATPPDPIVTENSLVATDVMPALSVPVPQAYSAAVPAVPTPTEVLPPTPAAEPDSGPTARPVRARTPMLIAAAAALGLILGGVLVSFLLRGGEQVPQLPVTDAQPETALTTTPAPPLAPPPAGTTTQAPVSPRTTSEEPEPTTTTEPAPPPPPSTTPDATTTTPTSPSRTSTTKPYLPFQTYPGGMMPAPLPLPGQY